MRIIIEYLLSMMPYMMITIPVYLGIRFCILRITKRKVNWYHETVLGLMVMFIVGLASQTVIPPFAFDGHHVVVIKSGMHITNLIPFKVLFDTYDAFAVNGDIHPFLINFLGNIVMFMPLGFALPLLWDLSDAKVIACGFGASLFIEFSQLFLTRGTDIDDLGLNTLGTILGLCLYKILYQHWKRLMGKFRS